VRQEIEVIMQAANGTPVIFLLLPTAPSISGDTITMSKDSFTNFVLLAQSTSGALVIDPSPKFEELVKTGHFPVGFFNSAKPDRGHLNRYGNRIVGELLADAIEEVLK
jgi:hypothetical protein